MLWIESRIEPSIFFNWRKTALQRCDGFCCTRMHIRHSHIYIPSLLSLPLLSSSYPSRPSQRTRLGSLCYVAASHQLSILHMVVYIYINATFSICPTLSFPHCVHKFPLCICVSNPSLQIGSSISFYRFYQFSSVAESCPTLCDPMNRSTPGLPVHHQLLEFTQTHVH